MRVICLRVSQMAPAFSSLRPLVRFVLCWLVALSTVTFAQTPQATFRSAVELVQIDAVVVDQHGNAVRGLTQADFVLTDRHTAQAIAAFEEVSQGRPAGSATPDTLWAAVKRDVASNASAQANRLVIVVVDDLHIWKGRTDKAKALARDVVAKLGNQASMALLFTSGEHSTQVTDDRSELLAAIDTLQARQPFRRPHEAKDDQKAAYVDPSAPPEVKLAAIDDAQAASLREFEDNMRQFKTLQGAAGMLRAESRRRKSFVLISEGIAKDWAGVFDATGNSAQMLTPDGALPQMSFHADAMRDTMEALRRSDVAMYVIDPRGRVRPEDVMLESWPPPGCGVCGNPPAPTDRLPSQEDSQARRTNPVRMAQDGLVDIASAAGGFAITDTDDLTGGVQRIIDDLDHYYLIGFYPKDTTGDTLRPINVSVPAHPEYTVRFRHGYMPGATAVPPANRDPLVELSSGVLPIGDLPLRMTALALAGPGKAASVVVTLEVTAPTSLMKGADSMLRDEVTYSILVVDDKKARVTSQTGRSAQFTLKGQDATNETMPDTVTYQIPITLNLAAGRYQLRASAMSKKLQKGGSVYLDLVVPDFSKAPIALSNIAIGYADGGHVPVGGASSEAQSPVPFDVTLDREFDYTDVLRVFSRLSRKVPTTSVAVTVAIVAADGTPLLSVDRSVSPTDPDTVEVRLPLDSVGPGAYRLRVAAVSPQGEATTQTAITVK